MDDEQFYQVFNTFMTETDETEAPIYNQVLELEAIELHRLAKIIESKGGYVLDLNTDCVSAAFPKDILPFTITDININDYYYDDAKTLPKYKLENKETRLEAPKLAK